jgi:hypothetical protein
MTSTDHRAGNERYRVRLRSTKGFTDTVMVWAEGEREAINDSRRWFQVQHDLGTVWIEEAAQRMGSEPDAGDLGVAESNEAVNHERLSPQGEILSTKFRVEPEHLRRSTRLMRESDRPAWQRLRERLRERGVDPSDAAVADISVHEPDPQNPLWLVVRGLGRTILVYWTAYDTLNELDTRWFWDQHPSLQTAEAILDSERLG